jgi:LPPG:FO 2-phospho-L-lactate transferase
VLPPDELAIVVNTADDFVHLGLHVSPDLDSVLYAIAGLNDLDRGWGLAGETWNFMDALRRLGGETWFQLGDRDLATHLLRTELLAAGHSLSEVTALLARRMGVAHAVAPMTDRTVRSIVDTDQGLLAFQDYFVKRQCQPAFRGASFEGAAAAEPSAAFRAALDNAAVILLAPSNPFVSIDPILALKGVRELIGRSQAPVVAVSPIVGGQAVKGPLAKMMRELGLEPSPLGIARHYGPLVHGWLIDTADRDSAPLVESLGSRVRVSGTIMRSAEDKASLARETLDFALELPRRPVR